MSNDYAQQAREKFYQIARFPRCIGVIDCTGVKIQSPGGEIAEIFRNRKCYFSINVQTVVDADLKIRDIVARWPGSTHDAEMFRNSTLYHRFETGHFGNGLPISDSGYPLKPYLITPLLQTLKGRVASAILHNIAYHERDSVPPISVIEEGQLYKVITFVMGHHQP
nr:unnamed protein product [Callosobruchus analis]